MSHTASFTERSTMKTRTHSHKKPLLQEPLSQKEIVKTNIMLVVSMISFGVMIAFIIVVVSA
jgi:hypothetical protein